ncbi:FHA domain-containing protein [Frankia sp. CNm7]|uniref:FHA domain-containing protein n=1 Tax=Frankia nepalensis TaxID=1836974 RepID=A0A937RLA8_9ACTN|nr:FHA domain-containing protein [Frankia nepalensis]MBL7502833.1 FHA domain-containing protein [Frankia nepalensis]MBL7509988.1 FHA domain-containing protein [Frankia nepalensis]MBL7522206.1 FHA domain-containing protein [Frankia nepalensis]MBL7628001.1 FHA domain-containing protein [Frankia nepalensis]
MSAGLTVRRRDEVLVVEPGRSFLVGRDATADLVVADPRVSRRHLLIEPAAEGWEVVDLSSGGTWLAGQRVGRVPVGAQSEFRLGSADGPRVTVAVAVEAEIEAGAPATMPIRRSTTPPLPREGTAVPASDRVTDPAGLGRPAAGAPGRPLDDDLTPVPGGEDASDSAAVGRHHAELTAHIDGLGAPPGPRLGPAGPGPTAVTESSGQGRVHPLRPGRMSVGRALTNDLVVGDLLASRKHAELSVGPGGVRVVDLGSANGTYVNGRRVERASLRAGDLIAVGHHVFHAVGDADDPRAVPTRLTEYLDTGDVAFEVEGLCVDVDGARLLHDISFRLPGRSLLAVIGPSGAGKTTLLGALTGFRPAGAGTVRYAGRDLYAEYDELRRRIGYVPQDDILHTTLTVRQALEYGARLRFPAETTRAERGARVDAVLAELGLTARGADEPDLADATATGEWTLPSGADLSERRVATLSGGQRKRTSIALELLTQPTLLYLDEPTSGLDPGLDQEVMRSLRGLADDGRTVVVATHSVAQLDLCDFLLVLTRGGHVAYFGPPPGALPFLGQASWADAFGVLGSADGAARLARRHRSAAHLAKNPPATPVTRRARAPLPTPTPRQQSMLSQLLTLSRRYARIIAADHSYLHMIITYPFLLGLLPRLVETPHGLRQVPTGEPNRDAIRVLLVVTLVASFLGMSNAIREIVKERPVYLRERAIGLSTTAYLGSKALVLTVITSAQSVVITIIGFAGRPPADGLLTGHPMVEMTVVVAATATAAAMMGLAVSALVDNADKAMPPLVVLSAAQLVLAGPLIPLAGRPGLNQLSWLLPGRWGNAAAASVTDLIDVQKLTDPRLNPGVPPDPLWRHTTGTLLLDLGALTALGLASLAAAGLFLGRLDPRFARPGPGRAVP